MIQPKHGFNPLLMRYLPELFGFEVKARSLYQKTDYISLLVNASIFNTYAEGMSNVSRKLRNHTPTGETALTYFKSIDRYELQSVVSIVLEEQVDELKRRGLLNRPVPIAFDWHDEMFYGDEGTEMVNGTKPKAGSCYAYQFLTASILVDGRRLTIVLTPIKSRKHLLEYVKDALNKVRNTGILVKHLLFDGGFSSLDLPPFLEENGYQYAIRFTPNPVTKRMNLRDGQSAAYPCNRPFRIIRADDKKEKRKERGAGPLTYLFATNMVCKARRILKRYKDRWGVETTYRKHNEFLAKTTSKNYIVRLLYYAVSICIYNVWCLFNVNGRHVIVLEAKVRLLLAASSFLAPAIAKS
jgi:Transposase DDE domain